MAQVAVHFNVADKLAYGCRLLRKVWLDGSRVVVHAPLPLLGKLDEILWSFDATEFLPHSWSEDSVALQTPILLSEQLPNQAQADLLLNLGAADVAGFGVFNRVIDVIGADVRDREDGRQRWRQYRELGWSVDAHDMGHWVAT